MAGCHGHDAPAPAPAPAPKVVDAAPPVPPADAAVPANPYVGSTTCADCHDKEYKAWRRSWHARALSPAEAKYVVGNFAGAHFAGTSSEAWMTRAKGKPVMRTHGPDGELADFPHLERAAEVLLDDLIWWGQTLRAGRLRPREASGAR